MLVTGPRQSGKTTFLKHEVGATADYVSFDDPIEREFALSDPRGFLAQFGGRPVIFDEIQQVPALLPYLKMLIDENPERLGHWLLTGSQQFALMHEVSESLAGRVGILELLPFSQHEFARKNLSEVLWSGSYPIPAMHSDRRDLWLRSYVATYIERDVRQIRSIPDLRSFAQFINLCAARHAQEFNAADISRDLGASQPTVKSWSGVLETSYLAHFLAPWFRNYGKRVVKSPKFYFLDAGLVSLLTRQPSAEAALSGAMAGALMEGWVVAEALKAFTAAGRKPELYFWRSHDGLEVDLLMAIQGKLLPVEIKLTATPTLAHLAPLNRFIELASPEAAEAGWLVCQCTKERRLAGGHLAIPWHKFTARLAQALSP